MTAITDTRAFGADGDVYPSRVGGEPAIVPRADPVVYGERPRSLQTEQWTQFRRDGYMLLPDFLHPDEVSDLILTTDQLRRELGQEDSPEVIREPGGRAVRSVFAAHLRSKAVDALCRHPRLLEIVRGILGSDAYIHQSRVNYKPGFEGKEFYWHSDFETWHVEDGMPRMRAISCSFSLTENNPYNGPVMVVPGSHHEYLACPGRTPEGHYQKSLVRQEYGVPTQAQLTTLIEKNGITSALGKAGSLLLFDCNLMHGSSSNISPYPRNNVFLVFNSVHNRLRAPYCGLAPRPEHIASRARMEVLAPREV